MSDLFDEPQPTKRKRAKSAHPEANLQTKIGQWCRESIRCKHKFKAFDRSQNSRVPGSPVGRHLFEWQRGLRRGTLDTCVITAPDARHHWIELKAPGVSIDPKDDEAQIKEIADIRELGGQAGWTNSVVGYATLLAGWGVDLYPLAMIRAEDLDRLLADAKARKVGKRPRSYRPRKAPVTAAGLRFAHTHAALGRPK
jgi:hypothetical protein